MRSLTALHIFFKDHLSIKVAFVTRLITLATTEQTYENAAYIYYMRVRMCVVLNDNPQVVLLRKN